MVRVKTVEEIENIVSSTYTNGQIVIECASGRKTWDMDSKCNWVDPNDPWKHVVSNRDTGICSVYFPKYGKIVIFEEPVGYRGDTEVISRVIPLVLFPNKVSTWNTFLRKMSLRSSDIEFPAGMELVKPKRKVSPVLNDDVKEDPKRVRVRVQKPPTLHNLLKDDMFGGVLIEDGGTKCSLKKAKKGDIVTLVQYERFESVTGSGAASVSRCGRDAQTVSGSLFEDREEIAHQYKTSQAMTKAQLRDFVLGCDARIFMAVFTKQPDDEETAEKLVSLGFNPSVDTLGDMANKVSHSKIGPVRKMNARYLSSRDRWLLNKYDKIAWDTKWPTGKNKQGKVFTPRRYDHTAGYLQVVDMDKMVYGVVQSEKDYVNTLKAALRMVNLQTLFMVFCSQIRAYDKNYRLPPSALF